MGLFDRNNNRGWRGMDDDHLRRDYENRSNMDAGADYQGMNRGTGGGGREGLWANSWSDGAWTADAADRTERDWHLGEGRGRYDRDVRPAQAGWRAGGMSGGMSGGMPGGMSGGMSGGMGMDRGGMDRDRGWNLGGGNRDWGHNWGSGNLGGGYGAGGMDRGGADRGGGFLDRAQNAVRRGWDRVEERFDRDDNGMHMGGGSMRGGTSWAGNYDRDYGTRGDTGVRGYRDDEGHYGVRPAPGNMNRGYGAGMSGGMNRYGADYHRGGMNRERYDENIRGGRNWF